MPDDELDEMIAANEANWDARTHVHLVSEFYNLSGQRSGVNWLAPFERSALGDLHGQDAVHLQCHLGLDTIELAKAGARTVGLDLSGESVAAAERIAVEMGVSVEFVKSNVYDAVEALGGRRFDLVYTGKGALVWLPDLDRWAAVVAQLLRPGGRLLLVEFHPLMNTFGFGVPLDEALRLRGDYLSSGSPELSDYPYSYTDGPPLAGSTVNFQWQHDLGSVVTALAGAGLRIESLHEDEVVPWHRFAEMVPAGGGWWRLPDTEPRLPLIYAITARAAA